MTATIAAAPPVSAEVHAVDPRRRILRIDYALSAVIAALTLVTRMFNIGNYPRWFIDEGVYVSQAWAVKNLGELAPYTYWYDHPPFGWIQIAGWFGLSGALERNGASSIMAGREYMAVLAVVTAVLIYALARRLGVRVGFALLASLLYVFSPLAIAYSRYVLLDNIAIAWALAAMFLTLNPKRKISAAILAALCMAAAVLSKETALLLVPAVLYLGWVHYRHSSNRSHGLIVSATIFVIMGMMYPLFAILKGELIPGAGHVSLVDGQILFQLANRQGSGSFFDPASPARQLAQSAWLGLDSWLPIGGLICLVPALFVKKLHGPAIALGVQVLVLLRGGYLPYPFIIGLLPFMALLIGGVADAIWGLAKRMPGKTVRSVMLFAVSLSLPVAIVFGAGPGWAKTSVGQFTDNAASAQQEALVWVENELPRDAVVITEGELWLDIVDRGYSNTQVVWIYKVDTDPAVRVSYTKTGIDYLLLNRETINQSDNYPTVSELLKRASVAATFGQDSSQIVALKVAP